MFRGMNFHEFRNHYEDLVSHSCYKMSLEFESLKPRGSEMMPWSAGNRGMNRPKNRFVNVLPFDHTRVILSSVEGVDFSDYINANHISDYNSSGEFRGREYIATQAPLKNMVNDFWRLCWESNTTCVVMLARYVDRPSSPDDFNPFQFSRPDREECTHYWPSTSISEMYGEIEVEVMSEILDGYRRSPHKWIISELKLRYKEQERRLRHYQFLTWTHLESVDPPEALVHFVREVRKYAPSPILGNPSNAPLIVHGSAGVGRTGTFIAVDIALNQIEKKKAVNIASIVSQMRAQRVGMVHTEPQYVCIYKCVIVTLDEIEANGIEFGDPAPGNHFERVVPDREEWFCSLSNI
ncbi:tyrosine-protein phosphatase 10D [Folsomia candida]|uniref:tyrosine-protein phosphatase 10D n=1 Tax=Folsomia candida TaxID=158441 RepID=UPI001604DC31|nr:tyrosine-protein phosphatase 10D [Folsomia candida]